MTNDKCRMSNDERSCAAPVTYGGEPLSRLAFNWSLIGFQLDGPTRRPSISEKLSGAGLANRRE